jgi:hypothetical protein
MGPHLQSHVLAGVSHQEDGDEEPEDHVDDPEIEGLRPQTVD